ncbi:hypothetical protein BJ322DRAFT_1056951 [Thelephora terrestris]|uniref:Survival Motor Neuron Gemin2-binding domain-containing protein n=1 Tax=Thelephora terrestris TaxID=56493 RepID=A0A9P6HGS0_9AGAM|nr:hypothetical protein BJ322DRAFT_1056951 [Thelephora terrestris]
MRSVVSYDDLEQVATTPAPGPPPTKKRKRQQNKRKSLAFQNFTHWDEPVENHHVSLAAHDYADELEDELVNVENRELTHEEIWDDSALIKAWDAAMDEYKAFHGPENKWKTDPTSRPSPLWYNVPPSPSTAGANPGSTLLSFMHEKQEACTMPTLEHNSGPLNFNTFVPSHDPALPSLAATDTQNIAEISQDEAFRNALNAMYWTGYWTAVYNCRSAPDQFTPKEMDDGESGEGEPETPDARGTMDEFVISQR